MPACEKTDQRRWTGPWEYVGAAARNITTGHGPAGITGTAGTVHYVWRRPYDQEFVCCKNTPDETRVWVSGFFAIYDFQRPGEAQPVVTLGAGVPLPGPLGVLADLCGADIDITHWWASPGSVDGECPSGPGEDADWAEARSNSDIRAPEATCGEFVDMPDGERVDPWHPGGMPVPPIPNYDPIPFVPPTPWREVDNACCAPLTWFQRKPVLSFVRREIRRVGGHYVIDLLIRITHPCGVRQVSKLDYFLTYPSGGTVPLTGLTNPLHTSRTIPNGKEFEWNNVQIPVPGDFPGGGFRVDTRAVSWCQGVLEASFKIT